MRDYTFFSCTLRFGNVKGAQECMYVNGGLTVWLGTPLRHQFRGGDEGTGLKPVY